MDVSVSSAAAEEPQPPKSFLARAVGVFYSPGSTFADIARKPDFVAPLIVAILTGIVFVETMLAKIGMERIVRASLERSPRASSMSPEQIERAVTQGAKIGAIIARALGLLGAPIFVLILAGIGLLIVNAIFGQQLSFGKAFAVACYANLVLVAGRLIAIVMILFGDPEHFNPENPTPTNLGFFLNPLETTKSMMALAGSFDVLSLALMGLLGVGFSEASERKVSAVTIFFIYFGIWLLWVLGKAGLAMLS